MDHLADRIYLWLSEMGLKKEAKKFLKKGQKLKNVNFSVVTLKTSDPAAISSELGIPFDGFSTQQPASPDLPANAECNSDSSSADSIETNESNATKPIVSKSQSGLPFKRVNPDEVEFAKDELKNNNFMAKKGASGSYGEKAYFDLKDTRGRDFKQEKNKKKRGAYKGGKIDTGVHSIKFDSDSD